LRRAWPALTALRICVRPSSFSASVAPPESSAVRSPSRAIACWYACWKWRLLLALGSASLPAKLARRE
jgi:hypothetical protein